MQELDKLSQHLFAIAAKNLDQKQRAFLAAKWEIVRQYGCQNAGLKKWGRHLLRLGPQLHNRLDKTFSQLVSGVEMNGVKVWKEEASDSHLERLLRILLDDNITLNEANFTLQERVAFFLQYDPDIVAQYRARFEQIFSDFYKERVWKEHDGKVFSMLVGNLIGLYPLFDPPENQLVKLLAYREGAWHLVSYRCSRIPLVQNRMMAYGLIPLDGSDPLLLFCATPYPAAQGFWEAIKSDLHPFRSVGENLFLEGGEAIDHFMQGKTHVQCYGVSLGGALAYHLGRKYGLMATVHAYVPPGLSLKNAHLFDIYGAAFYHVNDFVAHLGFHPTGDHFKSYAVITEANRNFVLAHTRPAGCNPTLMLEINSFYENRRFSRRLLTALKPWGGALLYLFLLPLHLIGHIYTAIRKRR
jgi:hypothetical protein